MSYNFENQPVITDDQEAARAAFALTHEIEDDVLATKISIAISDALMAKYKKGLDDGLDIGRGK
tara:strand:- start:252 stop:443 length:192 start_codon:yes stop_codon:yes gene_type:complete